MGEKLVPAMRSGSRSSWKSHPADTGCKLVGRWTVAPIGLGCCSYRPWDSASKEADGLRRQMHHALAGYQKLQAGALQKVSYNDRSPFDSCSDHEGSDKGLCQCELVHGGHYDTGRGWPVRLHQRAMWLQIPTVQYHRSIINDHRTTRSCCAYLFGLKQYRMKLKAATSSGRWESIQNCSLMKEKDDNEFAIANLQALKTPDSCHWHLII